MAIPFADSAPRPNSEFVSIDDLINFTFQANLRTPFALEDIREFIRLLRLANVKSVEQGRAPEKSPLGNLYTHFRGLVNKKELSLPPLTETSRLKEAHFEVLLKLLNNSTGLLRMEFTRLVVLNPATTFTKKVSSSPHQVAKPFVTAQAASGTVNTETMPSRFIPKEDLAATANMQMSLSDDLEKAVTVLQSSVRGSSQVRALARLKELLTVHKDHRAIIDVASLFRDVPAQKMADTIFSLLPKRGRNRVDGLCYYDHEGNCLVLERGSKRPISSKESTVSPKRMFTWFRQANTVGADQPMDRTTKAIVTLESGTTKDAAFQGGGRARLLLQGQTLTFVVTQEEYVKIQAALDTKEPVTVGDMLDHVHYAQGIRKESDSTFNLPLVLESELEYCLWENVDKTDMPRKQIAKMFSAFEGFLVKETGRKEKREEILVQLGTVVKPIPIAAALDRIQGALLGKWQTFLEDHPEWSQYVDLSKVSEEFDKAVSKAVLPAEMNMSDLDDGISEVEAENVGLQEEEVEQEVEVGGDARKPAGTPKFDGDYFALANKSAKVRLGIGVIETDWFKKTAISNDSVRKKAYQFLLFKNKGKFRYIPLSLYEVKKIAKAMERGTFGERDKHKEYFLFTDGKLLISDAEAPLSLQKKEDVEKYRNLAYVNILRKIYTGHHSLTPRELRLISKYFVDKKLSEKKNFFKMIETISHAWPTSSRIIEQLKQV